MVDVEALVRTWLAGQFTAARVVTELPANLETVVPLIKVERVGGPDRITLDHPTVDVECFQATRDLARKLAEQVRDALKFSLPSTVAGGGVVNACRTIGGPSFRAFDNPKVRRFGAAYQLHVITAQPSWVVP